MAPKAPHEAEEGIIELFDIVDAAEDAPKAEPLGPPAAAEAPVEARLDVSPDEDGTHTTSRYPFENGPDFLDDLDKTSEVILPPSQADAEPAPAAEKDKDAEAAPEIVAHEEPDEALIRAFEEEMAKAGAASGYEEPLLPNVSSLPDETLTDDSFPTHDEEAVPSDAAPEVESRPASPDFLEHDLQTAEDEALATSTAGSTPEPAVPPSEPLPSALSDAESAASLPPTRAADGTEERITRLEEALSRLNERVSALEQRLDESGADSADEALADLDALRTDKRAVDDETRSLAAALVPEPENAPSPQAFSESPTPTPAPEALFPESEKESAEGPDTFALALEALHERVALLERRPVVAPDVAGIAQDVLALVRVDMEKATEEQESVKRTLEEMQHRVQELEKRPLPQLILPDLPDDEAIAATVMQRIRGDLDRIAAEAAARVLREEIAGLMRN